jgi:hypothetical protein
MQVGLEVVTYSSPRHTACRSIPRRRGPTMHIVCPCCPAAGRGRGLRFPANATIRVILRFEVASARNQNYQIIKTADSDNLIEQLEYLLDASRN